MSLIHWRKTSFQKSARKSVLFCLIMHFFFAPKILQYSTKQFIPKLIQLDTTVTLNHGWASYDASQKKYKKHRKDFTTVEKNIR